MNKYFERHFNQHSKQYSPADDAVRRSADIGVIARAAFQF